MAKEKKVGYYFARYRQGKLTKTDIKNLKAMVEEREADNAHVPTILHTILEDNEEEN